MAKITKKEMFERIVARLTDVDEINFINNEIALLDRKSERAKNATRKPSKVQVANENLKSEILDFMATVDNATIKDVSAKFEISSQKATPLMNALVEDGKLNKVVEKRVAKYSLM
jgi:predicted HTH transcriptional regulator